MTRKRESIGIGRTAAHVYPAMILVFLLGTVGGFGQAVATSPVEGIDQAYDYAAQTLRVGVWLDKSEDEIYSRGADLTVGFETNEDAYAVVYRIDTEGQVTVLWPRSRFDDGFVFGAHEYLLPVTGAKRLRTSSRTGEGFVEAIVSRYPFDLRSLEVDFHHEHTADRYEFAVAGDPFLAMNEINFAVTGLEDAADFVVTNYATYYVHEKVDHPRYLCNQCHFEDDVTYDPYRDTCELDINVDYGWANEWYGTYEVMPVYCNPVYVYVDPWGFRPWVNFWYTPWYRCPPAPIYHWYSPVYVWCESPHYRGNAWRGSHSGNGRYRPLDRAHGQDSRTKTREYAQVSPMINKRGPEDDSGPTLRSGSGSRTGGQDPRSDSRAAVRSGSESAFRGQASIARPRTDFSDNLNIRSRGGLRIREGGSTNGSGSRRSGTGVRHSSGGGGKPARLTSVNRGASIRGDKPAGAGEPATARGSRSARQNYDLDRSARQNYDLDRSASGGRTIKPVEPRKKGTRIWSSGGGNGTDRTTGRSSGGRDSLRPSSRNQGVGGRSGRSGTTSRGSDMRSRSSRGSRSGSSKVTPQRKSSGSGGSKSSGSKSSGSKASSTKSSGSKSSGTNSSGSRSSGSRSSGSKSGGGRSGSKGSGRR